MSHIEKPFEIVSQFTLIVLNYTYLFEKEDVERRERTKDGRREE